MSRIGKLPVQIPQGVQVECAKENITVTGPKGTLTQKLVDEVIIELKDNLCTITRVDDTKRAKQMHGLYRQLIHNMVVGVSEGFIKHLVMVGVGYRAEEKQGIIGLNLGYSSQFEYVIPDDVEINVEKQTNIIVKGINKQRVGQVAAEIRSLRPPEPYKGKGVKYSNETIKQKEGKTGKK